MRGQFLHLYGSKWTVLNDPAGSRKSVLSIEFKRVLSIDMIALLCFNADKYAASKDESI